MGGRVPKEYIPGVEKGLESAKETGFLAGYPVVRLKTSLIDGAYHDVDSSTLAFEIASRSAFRKLAQQGAPKILEPIMKVEVITPEANMGDVIGDLNSKRAQINEMTDRLHLKVIDAFVPLSEMFGYMNSLRSMTEGRGSFNMEFARYDIVPRNVADEIIKARK